MAFSGPLTTTTGQQYRVSTNPQGQIHFGYQGMAKLPRPFARPPRPGSVLARQLHHGPTPGGGGQGQPAQPGAQPGQPQQPGDGSPLDSTYYGNVAANQFKVNQQINALNLQGAQAGTSLQAQLAQLAYAQPRAQLGLEQKANQSGALYSTPYNQSLGDLNYQYLGRQGAAQQKYSGTMSSIASKIAGLRGGESLFEGSQADASTNRATKAAAANPALGAPPEPPAAAPPGVTPAAARSNRAARSQLRPGSSHPLTTTTGQRYRVSTNPQGQVHFAYRGLAKGIAKRGRK